MYSIVSLYFPFNGVRQCCLRCWAIYTSTSVLPTSVYALSIVSIGVIYTPIVTLSIALTSVSIVIYTNAYTSVTSIVITVIPSSGAFDGNPYAFWENIDVFRFSLKVRIFWEYAANTLDPPLRASTSHGLLRYAL